MTNSNWHSIEWSIDDARAEIRKSLEADLDAFDYFSEVSRYCSFYSFVNLIPPLPAELDDNYLLSKAHASFGKLVAEYDSLGNPPSELLTGVKILEHVLLHDQSNFRVYALLGYFYSFRGTLPEEAFAVKLFRKTLSLRPQFCKIYLMLADIVQKVKLTDECIMFLQGAVDCDSNNPTKSPVTIMALFNLGCRYHFDKKDYGKAKEYYMQVLSIDPYVVSAYDHLDQLGIHLRRPAIPEGYSAEKWGLL